MATPTPIYEVAEEKFTVSGTECYGINRSNAANFDVKENECYGVALNSTSNGRPKCDDLGKNFGKTGKAVAVLFVLLLTLLLGVVAVCVVFALEISDLKSEIASLRRASPPQNSLTETPGTENVTQLLSQEILHTNEQLNSLISAIQELTTGLQQVMAVLGTRGQYATFPLDSCAALSPSSPSGHYWVRTPTGSAVLVYCDPTRSCGGVTGGWRRVAELDMTNSSQQCPSALRQRNDNIRTCGTDPGRDCSSLTFPTDSLSYSKVCGKVRA